jgi:hypothetical protein
LPIDVFIDLNKGTVYLSSERKLKIEEKVVHIAQRNQKRGVKKKKCEPGEA